MRTSRDFWRKYRRNRLAVLGAAVLSLLVVCAVLAPIIAPYHPTKGVIRERLQAPSLKHPLGTDDLGRDILSRIIFGSRISLQVAVVGVAISLGAGVPLGMVAGYYGGRTDHLIMRAMDILFAFPAILLAIAIMAVLGASTANAIVAIGIVSIPVFARIVRGSVLAVRQTEFIEAARALGMRSGRVLVRHVLPNATDAVIVQASLGMAFAILAEAALSFLGLGTQPPQPSWGSMLFFGREYMIEAPWISIFPGLAIFITVFSLNLIGDGLRDALDPKSR